MGRPIANVQAEAEPISPEPLATMHGHFLVTDE